MPFVSSVRGSYGLSKRPFPKLFPTIANSTFTGGSISTAGGYRIHTFTGPGSYTFQIAPTGGVANGSEFGGFNVEALVVAGGAGGGQSYAGGGGAADSYIVLLLH